MEIAVKNTDVSVPTKQLLRHHQREEYKGEIEAMESMMPNLKNPQDRGEVTRRLKRLKESLHTQSPTELPGQAKDRLYAESKQLEAEITQGMLSQEEMRKNPPGSVGQFMKWEKANKAKILRWKNIQQMLDPSSDDPDLSNLERLRPTGASDRVRLDAQIPGKMNYRSVPQERWDMAFEGKGPENTALKQAERVQAQVQEQAKPKRQMSEEWKAAARERLAAARAKKQAMKQNPPSEVDQSAPVIEGEPVSHEGA